MSKRLHLSAGRLEAQVVPEIGGSIARFDLITGRDRQPLFRGSDEDYSDVLNAGCFPLAPFCNRIREGRFLCDGREVRLSPNMAGDASPLHGQGWRGIWDVVQEGSSELELSYRHVAGEWPWSYEACQRISLDEAGLSVELSCKNLSGHRMPCALGLHPYYPCDSETILDTIVTTAWMIDAQVLPVEEVPATGRYDLVKRRICGQGLDNGFEGWNGKANIDWGAARHPLTLTSSDAPRFQVYSPSEGGLFVAEPVQNSNAALNEPQEQWHALGIALLERGEQRTLHARFALA